MTIAGLRRRVDRAKARTAPPVRRYDNRIVVGMFETRAEAIARHISERGPLPRGQGFVIFAAKPRTPEERAKWERRFSERQTRLIANARRDRVSSVRVEQPFVSPFPVGVAAKLPRFIVPKPWKAS